MSKCSIEIFKERVMRSFILTQDFYNYIDDNHLKMKISNLPSNTIGEQGYCIIGGRESYLKALQIGSWAGFSCSLKDPYNNFLINSKLEETYTNYKIFFQDKGLEEINLSLLIDLLEHEVQHHGQLIRYTYANKIGFPKSWNVRYTVEFFVTF